MHKHIRLFLYCLAIVLLLVLCGCHLAEHPLEQITDVPPQASKPDIIEPALGQLQVHFIDVGQADAILIVCDGQSMLIDGGNTGDSNLMYSYLQRNAIHELDYVIGTHAHEDHIGGLAGALTFATADTVYCSTTYYDSKAFENFTKAVADRGCEILIPEVNTEFDLGSAHAEILAVNAASGTNNSSIVLKLTHGDISFLFMADAEYEVEQKLVETYGESLDCTVLKVGHHGSSTSSSYGFLWHTMPEYAVISVGKGNSYGHPEASVLSRLKDSDTQLFRTDMQGDVIAVSDGNSVTFSVTRNADIDTFGDMNSK